MLVLTVLTRKRERLLVLEDAAFEAAKKLEAELAEGDVTVTETKTEMQKLKESVAALWQKILKLFSKKEAEEKESQTEEKNDGNEN